MVKYSVNGKLFDNVEDAKKYDDELSAAKLEEKAKEEEYKASVKKVNDAYNNYIALLKEHEKKYAPKSYDIDEMLKKVFKF